MKWTEITEKLGKDRFVLLFLAGIMCVIIAIPLDKKTESSEEKSEQMLTSDERGTENEKTGEEVYGEGYNYYYNTGQARDRQQNTEQYRQQLCSQLKTFLQKIEGAGQVEVFITMHASSEMIVERNSPYTRKNEEEVEGGSSHTVTETENESEVVLIEGEDGSQTPIVVKEIVPSIKGVVVAAQGAGNESVKNNICEALQALFGIEEHKIKVVKLNT